MKIPGFTAKASLYRSDARYQCAATVGFYDSSVHPAQSDVIGMRDPYRVTPDRSRYVPRSFPCILWTCAFWSPDNPSHCNKWIRSIGSVNPLTGNCE